ncbi:MAG: flippase-like domain-containing protein [Candidatus Eisenbacteria bacterium]|nr:flippase-like domain-containing protein [Candidatus Eisenbacteria bacterium]
MKGRAAGLILQFVISAVLLVLLTRKVPVDEAIAAFARVKPSTLAIAVALSLAGYWGRARRWTVLLDRAGLAMRTWTSYCLTLVGTFYGLFTPGRVGEFARVLHMNAPRSRTLPSVVWDRVADVVLLELMSIPAFLLVPAWRGALLAVFAALVAVTIAGIWVLSHAGVARAAARAMPFAAGPLAQWSESSEGMLSSSAFASSLGYGLVFYAFGYAGAWVLLRDLAPTASPQLLLGLPVIPLLGNLPIAFGGLGLREQVSAAIFGQFGAGAATGAAFSLLWFLTATLLPGLVGLALSALPSARVDAAAGGRS